MRQCRFFANPFFLLMATFFFHFVLFCLHTIYMIFQCCQLNWPAMCRNCYWHSCSTLQCHHLWCKSSFTLFSFLKFFFFFITFFPFFRKTGAIHKRLTSTPMVYEYLEEIGKANDFKDGIKFCSRPHGSRYFSVQRLFCFSFPMRGGCSPWY